MSPYKNSEKLNSIGQALEEEFNVKYLYSDFKKNNGYKRSIELSWNIIFIDRTIVAVFIQKHRQKEEKAGQE